MYSTTAIMSITQVGASTTNTTEDSLSQDTQVRLPLVLGDAGNEATTSSSAPTAIYNPPHTMDWTFITIFCKKSV